MLEASILPFYILEIIQKVNIDLNFEVKEGQDVFIMVNSKLEKLVISILEVLAIVSPQKLKHIKDLAFNKKRIQEMMKKAKIYEFITQVKECPILFSTQNYRLAMARYQTETSLVPNVLSICRVRVKDRYRKLEQIQKEIQVIITKYSESQSNNNDSWSMFHKKFCSCRKSFSNSSMTLGKGISLLLDDGRELAFVTGSGCHLPTGSSELCPSLTAIIKSSPNPTGYNISEQISKFSINQRGFPQLKNDQKILKSSLLYKVNNSYRILIGKKAAELKPQHSTNYRLKETVPLNKIIEEVFSKESLISFASTAENEELKLMFQPCCRGGLGLGSFILQPDNVKPNDKKTCPGYEETFSDNQNEADQLIKQGKALIKTAIIKQDIFTSETRTKIKRFLLSENPGPKNVQNTFLL